ncbi:MAG: cysteine methyltransferase [Candidatus Margulisiibacteriota bacterium]|nr:MAG: cysteine methyltransferase [Candidatus Margulisiibacteriota bacterium]HAR61893.1 cysteine methyltransferase [Candidatus Margulisiibacteriota bacterium]HCT84806.1 cysteine methyltransferase [Candidatus Margulisiibacteriota bacterium]HCY36257.1 cysteine methyltransferase [Candidatus Margulisiibacteriota bacterium]
MKTTIYYNYSNLPPLGNICLAGTNDLLYKIALGNNANEDVQYWLSYNISEPDIIFSDKYGTPFFDQLKKYFDHELKQPEYPYFLEMPPFTQKVLQAVASIPYGQTRTYGEIALMADSPRASRAVGNACHANPLPLLIPCHRVISQKDIGGFAPGIGYKKTLLQLEAGH